MSGYPIQLITDYREGKISRQQFTKQFSDWQKANTINFDCKGTADKSGVHMTYRGEMQQKQIYFLQQAKKWGALWN